MVGKFIKTLLLILLIVACGKKHSTGAPRFLPGQIVSEEMLSRLEARTFLDLDKDGIADRFDPDIDGDGVANLADESPFDKKFWGTDLDKDGISDFIDQSFVKPHSAIKESIQNEIFEQTGVVVIEGKEIFVQEEWIALKTALLHAEIKQRFTHLKTIVKYSEEDQINENRADYDSHWMQINFYPNPVFDGHPPGFLGGLIHELGHVQAAQKPAHLEAFKKNPRFVSTYAETNLEEAFAENYVYDFYQRGVFKVDPSRFSKN